MKRQTKLRLIDIKLLDDIFDMNGGYVLDFSNRTFAEFFLEEFNINIDDPRYDAEGKSKAKRFRYFLKQASTELIVTVLLSLWEYRETIRRRNCKDEEIPELKSNFFLLIKKLGGKPPEEITPQNGNVEFANLSNEVSEELLIKLMNISSLEPHARGYAFEGFLKELFDKNGMNGRSSFRVTGEQIDGSFEMSGEVYLLEAKWTSKPVDAATLRGFNAKVEDKASWSRGLFVSDSGFSQDGLIAFGRGKSVVCMDGLDISEMLQRKLSLNEVLSKKVRRAAETGNPFVRLRDLV